MDDRRENGEGNKLLIAASGTGGHLFPAIATAEHLPGPIEWLGVPDRLETELVPKCYPLHTVRMGGVQGKVGLGIFKVLFQFAQATLTTRRLLQQGNFRGVFTTGGYIAAPAIIAARSLGLPAVLHESNAMPGKVTRWLSRWCSLVAIGFKETRQYLPGQTQTVWVGTPVRSQFLADSQATLENFDIPDNVPVIVVIGGSQGAVAVNQLVRAAAPAWLEAGAWIIHQTGTNDPDTESLSHPHYLHRPFFENVAALFKRATLVISRAGAGTLTELAMTHSPSVLIPYPFAADDHQAYNANAFGSVGASKVYRQAELNGDTLQKRVLALLETPDELACMRVAAEALAVNDSAEQVANLLQKLME
ncbi:udp-n-acetylglucosamine-n-acetylmuramyl-pyrophosphoryl-undecaprenol n-acetylglucosamine transferase [Leptolyngbya sp. Heron Island J]|uniref:undecaprenyldiphospho-muramoylpentapeptide beta-N-acetylglucosaminyltransferase n=1 Tax=Leptolyngbya sp. Heron Island J TaxID=1385935 RepID=UPI0003B9A4FE|nr:undecaprenyldiphospho-muramoylpentapeptide beta-N-acetylglucosaminyltransferase [Leptolyngbya sp. Heron Island J]ESA32003.1 udp-n-acetylglucosamine-n-acetylmuramyl-pyrophosphoryl-undecaprenol n-acetylglucosamine transferase [Leptolyngbya sp. Heron Island J]